MKKLLLVFIIFTSTTFCDQLLHKNGNIYTGEYLRMEKCKIVFKWKSGDIVNYHPNNVKKILDDDNNVILSQREINKARFLIKHIEVEDLEYRQTIALEKIAKSQTFFMYYLIAIEVITFIYVVVILT